MVLLDGKKLSQKILDEIREEISRTQKKLRLAIIVVGDNPVINKFIEQKKKTAEGLGIDVRIYPFEESITTNELRQRIADIVHEEKNSGVIVQLPLPPHINKQYILNAVPPTKDVDMLSSRSVGLFATGKSPIFPPVVGAIKAFFDDYAISLEGKEVLIMGAGSLVGRPVALWLLGQARPFSIITDQSSNPEKFITNADVIISGIGRPKFLTGEKIKDGVIIIDAGTSESEGKLVGDTDFESVGSKASFMTPVPGGIGPVTVAILFKNLVTLSKK